MLVVRQKCHRKECGLSDSKVIVPKDARPDWREMIAVVLLTVTAIVTAWSGFQASKWSGAMSISFSQASKASDRGRTPRRCCQPQTDHPGLKRSLSGCKPIKLATSN